MTENKFDNESIKVSPFVYADNVKVERELNNISYLSIKKLRADGTITSVHSRILSILKTFGYLNAFHVRVILSKEQEVSSDSVRRMLSVLFKYGLVVRYQLSIPDEEGEHLKPYIYSVSAMGESYLKAEGEKIKGAYRGISDVSFSVQNMLRILSFNQLHVMLLSGSEGAVKKSGYHAGAKKGESVVDGFYELEVNNRRINVLSASIRTGFENYYLGMLKYLQNFAAEHRLKGCIYIIVVESEVMALVAERYRKTDVKTKDIDIYYVTDRALLAEEGIFTSLLKVKPENNYMGYSMVSLSLVG